MAAAQRGFAAAERASPTTRSPRTRACAPASWPRPTSTWWGSGGARASCWRSARWRSPPRSPARSAWRARGRGRGSLRTPTRGAEDALGVPAEVKVDEYRVALGPAGRTSSCATATTSGWSTARAGLGLPGRRVRAGRGAHRRRRRSVGVRLVLKVKEPQPAEFGYLHMTRCSSPTSTSPRTPAWPTPCAGPAPPPSPTRPSRTATAGCPAGPMSEIAGRLAVQAGARRLEKPEGAASCSAGSPGSPPARWWYRRRHRGHERGGVAAGMQAHSPCSTRTWGGCVSWSDARGPDDPTHSTRPGHRGAPADRRPGRGRRAGPRRARADPPPASLRLMRPGSVIVDVAVDQGQLRQDLAPTTHCGPVYGVDSVVHYGVANMPDAVPSRPPGRWETPPCPTSCASPTGLDAALAVVPGLEAASTSGTERSSTRPSRRRWPLTVGGPPRALACGDPPSLRARGGLRRPLRAARRGLTGARASGRSACRWCTSPRGPSAGCSHGPRRWIASLAAEADGADPSCCGARRPRLVEWAREARPDVIVAASHAGRVAGALGSTARRLAMSARARPQILPPGGARRAAGARGEAPCDIACCIDDSPGSMRALAEARRLRALGPGG